MGDDDIAELFQTVRDLRIRRMFGGKGIYDGEVIIALYAFDTLFLKSDAKVEQAYRDAGSEQFCYAMPGRKPVSMPYFSCPTEAFDEPDLAERWIALALDAGHRSFAAKGKPRRVPVGRRRRDGRP